MYSSCIEENLTEAISIKSLVKKFDSFSAVDNISFSVPSGSFLVLVGPSGCGKSTLLRMLAGLEAPTEGEINFVGETVSSGKLGISKNAASRNTGLVFQSYALWPHMTVEANIEWPLKVAKWPVERRATRVNEVLKMLDIEELRTRYPAEISGGQQQRVAIARTIGPEPKILLFDEPLSNLDAKLRVEMRAELMRIHRTTGATSVYVTHDQVEAMTMATHVAVLNNGRIEQFGTPEELITHPQTTFVATFLGTPPANLIPVTIEENHYVYDQIKISPADSILGLKQADLMFRPSDITVGKVEGRPTISAVYAESAPIAGQSMVTAMINDMRITAIVDGFYKAEPGETIELSFLRPAEAVFNKDGNRV